MARKFSAREGVEGLPVRIGLHAAMGGSEAGQWQLRIQDNTSRMILVEITLTHEEVARLLAN